MTVTATYEKLGLSKPWEQLERVPTVEGLRDLEEEAGVLVKAIQQGTVTVDEIDAFLDNAHQHETHQLPPSVEEYLLCSKALQVAQKGGLEQALQLYDEALKFKEEPSTWALKGTLFLQMERLDEAFQAFEKAYLLRDHFGIQRQGYLTDLFAAWSMAGLLQGLDGILQLDSRQAESGVKEYLSVLDKATSEDLQGAVPSLAAASPVPEELQDALEELEIMVRLLSIRNPFDRWRELTKEISKVWPEGLSAVDAIREQRDHEWNT